MDPINQSFVDYIARHDFEAAQAAEVAAKLAAIGITTVKHFVGYFSHGTDDIGYQGGGDEDRGGHGRRN